MSIFFLGDKINNGGTTMGCLKNIIKSVILCFAVIGFMSIGGGDFVKEKWADFTQNSAKQAGEKAQKYGDFSNIPDEYEISNSASLFGYKGVIAEHKSSGQKMIILDSDDNILFTPADITQNRVEGKINAMTKKIKYSAINIKELKLGSKGTMRAYGKTVPYVKFNAKISKLPLGEVDGMLSAYEDENSHKILIAANEKNKYSQVITQEFFKNVKK